MKKILIPALAFSFIIGMSTSAFSAAYTNPAGGTATTTILGGATFKTSSNVTLDAIATVTAYAASAKHIAGGTTEYGTTNLDTDFTATKDRAADAAVTNQGDAANLATP